MVKRTALMMSMALMLVACGETTETAGPKMLKLLSERDLPAARTLAAKVKGLGNFVDNPDVSETVLQRAAHVGDPETVKSLLDNGADPNLASTHGFTPLHLATESRNDAAGTIKLLVAAGAKVDAVDREGRTPLFWAAEGDYLAAAIALLEAGANPDVKKTPTSDSVRELFLKRYEDRLDKATGAIPVDEHNTKESIAAYEKLIAKLKATPARP